MNYRKLGNSSIKVSEIGFGCMSLQPEQHAQNETLLRTAFDAGITLFDTADLYDKGANETTVGKALAPIRDQVVIATKVGNQWNEDGKGWTWNPSKTHILSAVEESLKRLQTDYIDLYQLHGGTLDDDIPEIIEAFELLKQQGKIRAYGISSIRPNVIREWVKKSNLDSVMMQYSLLDRRPEEECLDYLHRSGVSVLTRGSLAKGMLINKPANASLGYDVEEINKLKAATVNTQNPVSSALQYVLQHPAVASAISGVRTLPQLSEIIESTSVEIPANQLAELGTVLPPNKYEQHR